MLLLIDKALQTQNNINIFDFFSQIGIVGKLVLATLLFFSIVSWAIMFYKWKIINGELRKSKKFLLRFHDVRSMQDKYRIANKNKGNILSDSFRYAYDEAMNQIRGKDKESGIPEKLDIEAIERALFLKINEGISKLENRLNFLATTATVTPFIGLFGTVWGIMDAFRQIGLQGSADLATVAPGISEALINTAAGLFAAIPAVIAYNYFLRKIKDSSNLSESFVLEVANLFQKIKF